MALKWTLGTECIKMIPPNRICQNQAEGVPTHLHIIQRKMHAREEANPLSALRKCGRSIGIKSRRRSGRQMGPITTQRATAPRPPRRQIDDPSFGLHNNTSSRRACHAMPVCLLAGWLCNIIRYGYLLHFKFVLPAQMSTGQG